MFYGTLQHNMTLCNEFEDNLKPIKEIRDTKSSDGIYNAFYEIYLSFTRVSLSAKFSILINNKVINLVSDTSGNPIFQKVLQNKPSSPFKDSQDALPSFAVLSKIGLGFSK